MRPKPLAMPLLAAVGLVLALVLPSAAGCGSSNSSNGFTPTADGGGPGSDATADSGGDDGGSLIGSEGGLGTATSLAITPASSTLTVTSLTSPQTETLTARVTYSGGNTVNMPASWTVDRPDIASVTAAGVVTPTAAVFGPIHVTATVGSLSAKATVTVAAKVTVESSQVPAGSVTQLQGATAADPAVTAFAYPYDQTVFPLGLQAPEVQWNGGAAGDQYLLHFTTPNLDLQVFTTADPPSRFTLTPALWNTLTSTAATQSVTVALSRLSAGKSYASAKQTWKIANADLRGIIYYWAISQGQIISLDLATGVNKPVFDSGPSATLGTPTPVNASGAPTPPWQDNGAGKKCVACHSVSKDGSTLVSIFSKASPGSTGPLGVISLASDTITAISDYTTDGTYDSLTPDGRYSVVNYSGKTMGLLQTATATPIASALDGQANLCDPTFSPDGTLFALASNCDPGFGYPVEFRTSNLTVYSFSATTAPYFTGAQTVLTSAGVGDAIAFPSFSPDSKFIFYQRGDYSRAKYTDTTSTNTHGNDDLYVAPAAASATQIALANLNGAGVLPARDLHLNYGPTVNPIAVGGYFWVVFTSPRDYGNEMVAPGTAYPNDPTYANRKQLWVAAVDANIGTTDPSHPAFWLPGQDFTTANMFGYWALAPCKPTSSSGGDGGGPDGGSASCTAGFECCSGYCDNGSCSTQSSGCSNLGDKCTTAADCCTTSGSTIACIGGFCEPQQPQ
jgi:hypothetical protein